MEHADFAVNFIALKANFYTLLKCKCNANERLP